MRGLLKVKKLKDCLHLYDYSGSYKELIIVENNVDISKRWGLEEGKIARRGSGFG